jgi:hypothetical protein
LDRSSEMSQMDTFESRTHSFLIRVWVEERSTGVGPVLWHGQIIHVPTGKRLTLYRPDDVMTFLWPYFVDIGIQPGTPLRVKRWLKQWLHR